MGGSHHSQSRYQKCIVDCQGWQGVIYRWLEAEFEGGEPERGRSDGPFRTCQDSQPAPFSSQSIWKTAFGTQATRHNLSLIHISEPTRLRRISYAVFCLKKIAANVNTTGSHQKKLIHETTPPLIQCCGLWGTCTHSSDTRSHTRVRPQHTGLVPEYPGVPT